MQRVVSGYNKNLPLYCRSQKGLDVYELLVHYSNRFAMHPAKNVCQDCSPSCQSPLWGSLNVSFSYHMLKIQSLLFVYTQGRIGSVLLLTQVLSMSCMSLQASLHIWSGSLDTYKSNFFKALQLLPLCLLRTVLVCLIFVSKFVQCAVNKVIIIIIAIHLVSLSFKEDLNKEHIIAFVLTLSIRCLQPVTTSSLQDPPFQLLLEGGPCS